MRSLLRVPDNKLAFESSPLAGELANLVSIRLRRSGYAPLWCVKCEAHEDVVSLTGTVPTFHLKQIAQELAVHTVGVRRVENRLLVACSRESDSCTIAATKQ